MASEPATSEDTKALLRNPAARLGSVSSLRHIRVLVADDHPILRKGLSTLLRGQPDFVVVGEAHDGMEALRLVKQIRPDIMLLDFSMPGMSAVDVMREMRRQSQPLTCQTIVLSAPSDQTDVVKLLRSGARGVVSKDSPIGLVFKSIRKVHAGEVWLDRGSLAAIVDALVWSVESEQHPAVRDFGITRREREILLLVVEGETNKAIANRLTVGEDTVKHHLTSIFDKTGVSNRLELALFAIYHHLVPVHTARSAPQPASAPVSIDSHLPMRVRQSS
jgi:two-component system nitrate/nitrite response regulator NarL